MGGFDHGPNVTEKRESEQATRRNARYGLILFAVYLAVYSGFVLLNAFAPEKIELEAVAGVNVAIAYGLALIAAAFLLALLYGWLCGRPATPRDAVSKTAAERRP